MTRYRMIPSMRVVPRYLKRHLIVIVSGWLPDAIGKRENNLYPNQYVPGGRKLKQSPSLCAFYRLGFRLRKRVYREAIVAKPANSIFPGVIHYFQPLGTPILRQRFPGLKYEVINRNPFEKESVYREGLNS